MADKEIGDLTSAGTLDGTETLHLVQSGNSRKSLLSGLKTFIQRAAGVNSDAEDGTGTTPLAWPATALKAAAETWRSGAPDAVLEDQKAANTGGGTSSTSWATRDLNTEVRDILGVITLASNQFTPSVAGWVEWSVPGYSVQVHKTRLYNVTDTVEVKLGSSEVGWSTVAVTSRSVGGAAVVAGKTYAIQHKCQVARANGFGYATNFGTEIYTQVKFWRT